VLGCGFFVAVTENNGTAGHGIELLVGAGVFAEEFLPHLVLHGGGKSRTKLGTIDASTESEGVVIDYAQIATPPVFCYISAPSSSKVLVVSSTKSSIDNGSKVESEVQTIKLFGSHVDVIVTLVCFLEGIHHGGIKITDGFRGGLTDTSILELEVSFTVAGILGRDQRSAGSNEGESEGGKFHHGSIEKGEKRFFVIGLLVLSLDQT